jgi:poly(hydroxyalkanoate) depolymerase family esterase
MTQLEPDGARQARCSQPILRPLLAFLASLAAAGFLLPAPQARADGGSTETFTDAGQRHHRLYTPPSYRADRPAALIVALHGCQTSAAEMQAGAGLDRAADRTGTVVLYPDDDDGRHALRCWTWTDLAVDPVGAGDLAIVLEATRHAMRSRNIDPERVYAAGSSSGALIVSSLVASHPDVYTAVGVMSGQGYGASCLVPPLGPAAPDEGIAQGARQAMRDRARVVPFIVLHGDADPVVSPRCGAQAVRQWIRTDNLVLSGQQQGPISLDPAERRSGRSPAGVSYDRLLYRQPSGCLIGEHWTIHGMGHAWAGSNKAPEAPSASDAMAGFFARYRRSDTTAPCAETRTTPAAASPPASEPCRSHRRFRIRIRPTDHRILRARVRVGGRDVRPRRSAGGAGRWTAIVDLRRFGRRTVTITTRAVYRTPTGTRTATDVRRYRPCRPGRATQP